MVDEVHRYEEAEAELARQEALRQRELERRLGEAKQVGADEIAASVASSEAEAMRAQISEQPAVSEVSAAQRLEASEAAPVRDVPRPNQMKDTPLHLQGDQPDCLLQSARMAEHRQTGVDPGLEAYKTPAIEEGAYDPVKGTDLVEMEGIINDRPGIEAQLKFDNRPEDIKKALDSDESVIAAVDAYEFYKGKINLEPNSGGHAVVVTSGEKLPSGDWEFAVNDPNFEPPNQPVAGDRFANAWGRRKPMIVVKKTGVA